jgi:hypothetical protein
MAVSKALLDAFRVELETQAGKASSYALAYLEAMRAMFPDVGVAEVRDAAIEAIRESLSIYGDQAAALAGALFDQLAAEHGYAAGSTVQSVIDDAEIERKVRYFAGSLASGKVEEFDRSVSDLTGYYVKRSAFENMVRNCERNGIRYARVPSGTETCAFCFMLSSRGFVYRSKGSASRNHRTGDGYHRNCDCIVVPGFGDLPPDAQVEGYAPSQMYDRWSQCADTVGIDAKRALGSEELRRAVLQEVETRDWRWLYTGKVPEITKDRGAKPLDKEKAVADILARNGFAVHFLKETNKTGVKTADALLNGEVWEFKIPEGWSKPDERSLPGEHTVRRQFFKALGKGTDKILISNEGNGVSMDELLLAAKKVFESRDYDFSEVFVVDAENRGIRRLK